MSSCYFKSLKQTNKKGSPALFGDANIHSTSHWASETHLQHAFNIQRKNLWSCLPVGRRPNFITDVHDERPVICRVVFICCLLWKYGNMNKVHMVKCENVLAAIWLLVVHASSHSVQVLHLCKARIYFKANRCCTTAWKPKTIISRKSRT